MRAVRYYDKNDIRIENVPDPKPESGGLVVRVEACAICGTDLKMWLKGDPRVPVGQIIGHEFVGTVLELGPGASGFAVGDRVTMATTISCMRCGVCRAGHTNRCENVTPVSRHYPGAFANFIAVPAAGVAGGFVVKVPPNLGDAAALAEPVSCAINAQILAGVKLGDTVVIVGFGPLGAIHTELAKAFGATRVMVTERSPQRVKLAEQFDVDAVIDAARCDAAAEVMRLTDGVGADVVIATAPAVPAQEQALSMARKGGMVNLFAGLPKGSSQMSVDSRLIHYRELLISGASDSTPRHVELAVKLLAAGRLSEKLITHRVPIGRFMEGLTVMKDESGLKVLVIPE